MASVSEDDWRREAACRFVAVETFFPERGDHRTVTAALDVCKSCPVKEPCLEENIFQRDGIYGGMTARQRRQFRLRERPTRTRRCIECAHEFVPTGSQQLICSEQCKSVRHMRQRRSSEARNA